MWILSIEKLTSACTFIRIFMGDFCVDGFYENSCSYIFFVWWYKLLNMKNKNRLKSIVKVCSKISGITLSVLHYMRWGLWSRPTHPVLMHTLSKAQLYNLLETTGLSIPPVGWRMVAENCWMSTGETEEYFEGVQVRFLSFHSFRTSSVQVVGKCVQTSLSLPCKLRATPVTCQWSKLLQDVYCAIHYTSL